jgi:hypothetical protein
MPWLQNVVYMADAIAIFTLFNFSNTFSFMLIPKYKKKYLIMLDYDKVNNKVNG